MQFQKRDLRPCDAPPHIVPMVDPVGGVIHVHVNNTIDSPILQRELVEHPKTGEVTLRGVTVGPVFYRQGWRLLEDLYAQDPDGKGPERWADYLKHMAYGASCALLGQKPDPFPLELLPAAVLKRRKDGGPMAQRWSPTSTPLEPEKAKRRRREAGEVGTAEETAE